MYLGQIVTPFPVYACFCDQNVLKNRLYSNGRRTRVVAVRLPGRISTLPTIRIQLRSEDQYSNRLSCR